MEQGEARIVVRHMDDLKEVEVGNLLLDVGLELVAVHVRVRDVVKDSTGGEDDRSHDIGEVDLLFKHGDTAYIIEVSVQSSRGRKLKTFFDVFSKTETLEILKKLCPMISRVRHFERIYFDRNHAYKENELDQIWDSINKEGNHIVLNDEFDKLRGWVGQEKRARVEKFCGSVRRNGKSSISIPHSG